VQPAAGETVAQIAARYRVPVEDLLELNGLADGSRLPPGRPLFVPAPASRPAGDDLVTKLPSNVVTKLPSYQVDEHGNQVGPPGNQVGALALRIPGRPTPGAREPLAAAARLAWPVDARVTISSPFGPREGHPHDGIDLAVPDGTPVHAAAAGQVIYAGEGVRGYGRLVIVQHDPHLVTVYAHNSSLLVAEGQRVAAGQPLALSGHSGHVTAPHCHFEVREDSVPQNPERYLPPPAAEVQVLIPNR
jgi:murein DD-endopeptidase MepM/ murein hydrolase activator NlpD